MVTIYSIAERCGVSAATVSRALSRPELVSAPLRARIQHTAEEMGYRANRNARRLAKGVSGLVAVIVPDITNPYFPPIVAELGRLLEASGSSMLMVDAADDPDRELAAVRRLAGEVDSFLLISPRSSLRVLQNELRHARAVLVNRPARTLNHVLVDETAAIESLFGHIRAGGHRRAGYLGGPADSWVDGRRRTIARESAGQVGVELIDLGAHPATLEAGERSVTSVLAAEVTAVVAFDDTLALGLLDALSAHGVDVPRQVGIAAFDDLSYSSLVRPGITSIGADPAELARAAHQMLGTAVAGQLEGVAVHVTAELRVRASLSTAVDRLDRRL